MWSNKSQRKTLPHTPQTQARVSGAQGDLRVFLLGLRWRESTQMITGHITHIHFQPPNQGATDRVTELQHSDHQAYLILPKAPLQALSAVLGDGVIILGNRRLWGKGRSGYSILSALPSWNITHSVVQLVKRGKNNSFKL